MRLDSDEEVNSARCQACIDIGIECPQGYSVEFLDCDVCTFKMVLVRAMCNKHEPYCLECKSKSVTISSSEDDGP